MKKEIKKRGPKPKLSIEEKKNIATSYYITGGDMSKRGIFTRLMNYANENGFLIKNINIFSEDSEFCNFLDSLMSICEDDVDPAHIVVGNEDIDVPYYLNLSKPKLEANLVLLREKIRKINKAASVAIEKYKTINELADSYRRETEKLKDELELTKVKLKNSESEGKRLKAQLQEYIKFISEKITPSMEAEQMENIKGVSKEKLKEIAMTPICLSKNTENYKSDSLDELFECL